MGNWGQFQIMGSLGGPAIPKFSGVWATPKSYVGHIGLDTNFRACLGPSRTCTLFVATMSVRIFGNFLRFSIFFARRAPCSAPPCTPEAGTIGPYMVCSSCICVPMTPTPHGWTDAHTHWELVQDEYGSILTFWHWWAEIRPTPGYDHWRYFRTKYMQDTGPVYSACAPNAECHLHATMEI